MSAPVGMRIWRRGCWVLRRFVYFALDEIIFSERGCRCLVGVDIGVEVEPTANGDGVEEPALTGAEDGNGSGGSKTGQVSRQTMMTLVAPGNQNKEERVPVFRKDAGRALAVVNALVGGFLR